MKGTNRIRRRIGRGLTISLLATVAALASVSAAQATPDTVYVWGITGTGDYSAGRANVTCARNYAQITGASPLVYRAPTGHNVTQRIEMWPYLRIYVGNGNWNISRWGTPQAFNNVPAPNGTASFVGPSFWDVQSGYYIAGYLFRWYENGVKVGEAMVESGYGDYWRDYGSGGGGPYYCNMTR